MSEFKVIETQEALDAIIKDRLDRQKKAVTDEIKKQYEGWISPEEAKKSTDQIAALNGKLSDSEKTIADLTAKNSAYEISSVKMRIAHETGLPYELAERLSGTTEEDIRKDAETLAQFTSQAPATPSFSSEPPVGDSTNAAFIALAQSLNT
jgi:hypothetical protein